MPNPITYRCGQDCGQRAVVAASALRADETPSMFEEYRPATTGSLF